MALDPDIIQRISFNVGKDVATLEGVRVFMKLVKRETGVELGRNTLRRLFGIDSNPVKPRDSTLNIIARTLGFPDWNRFKDDKPTLKEGFHPGKTFFYDMVSLEKGVLVGISWTPNRRLTLEHLGDGEYKVLESEKGKLRKDDILSLETLTVGLPFSAIRVVRSEHDLGPYNAAEWSAIDDISFFPHVK